METVFTQQRAELAQSETPKTSLIICSRNRPQLLVDLVQSILQGNELPDEIVIIDQSEQPNHGLVSYTPNRDCLVNYIHTDSVGVSRGRNLGAARARYEILVFTDDDMLAPAEWFGHLTRALFKAGQKSVVTGRVDEYEPEIAGAIAPSIKSDPIPAVYQGRLEKDVLYTNNMAIFRSAFYECGLFDERLGPGTPFPAAEDNDLCFRLLEMDYQILYEPKAAIFHRAWRSPQENLKLQWNYGYGQGAFYAKHMSIGDGFMIQRLAKDLFNYTLRLPIRFWRKRYQARADANFAMGLLSGTLHWIQEYKFSGQ